MKSIKLVSLLSVLILAGCAGPNPNPGERTTDIAWTSGNYDAAYKVVEPHALNGEPWAQLRLAIFYHNGWGVEQDLNKAEALYRKAMVQRGDDDWSNGKMIGAIGDAGYFNQNSDAIVSEFNLASLYYETKEVSGNLAKAYFHISNVLEDSQGKAVFFCCEFAGGRGFTYEMFEALARKIKSEASEDELAQAIELTRQQMLNDTNAETQ